VGRGYFDICVYFEQVPHCSYEPDLSHMQIFGCTAYAKILIPLKKLDRRSKKCIFVGYTANGYILWNEEKMCIFVSRDVVFNPKIVKCDYTKESTVKLFDLDDKDEDEIKDNLEGDDPENIINDDVNTDNENVCGNQPYDLRP
jgi:hypothetical protein